MGVKQPSTLGAVTSIRGRPAMTRRDQELLDKQFRWRARPPANAILPLSIFTAVLLCVFLGGAITP